MRFILRLLINAAALWVATQIVPGVRYDGDVGGLLIVALVFGVLNAFVRPILGLLSCPLMVLTLGLFTLVLNAILLWLTGVVSSSLGQSFHVDGLIPAFLGALVVSIVSIVLSVFVRDDRER